MIEVSTGTIDVADLIATLVSLKAPDRAVDRLIHSMLGGRAARTHVDPEKIRLGNWLAAEVPAYTSSAAAVLGYQLGARVSIEPVPNGYQARAEASWSPRPVDVVAPTSGGAACAALASLAVLTACRSLQS